MNSVHLHSLAACSLADSIGKAVELSDTNSTPRRMCSAGSVATGVLEPIAKTQGRRNGFENGDIFASSRKKMFFGPFPFAYLGDLKQNIAIYIVVIKTSKRLPAANEIT
jgi:hypothetical protein